MNGGRTAAAALGVLALAGCGGGGSGRVLATVGPQPVTQEQVDRLVERGAEEAKRERRDFPRPGSDAYRALEREALRILVARAQLEVAAQRVGVTVGDEEARQLAGLAPPRRKEAIELAYEDARRLLGIPESGNESAALRLDEARLQLTLQKLVRRLGRDGVQPFLARSRKTVPVRYR